MFDVFGEAFCCFYDGIDVEIKVFFNAGDSLLFDEDFYGLIYLVGGYLSFLSNFIRSGRIEEIVLQEFFDSLDQFLLGGVKGFGVGGKSETVFVFEQFFTS